MKLKCQMKDTGKFFTIVGLRIHAMNISNEDKRNQFQFVLEDLLEEKIIIAGDFNCNRRSFDEEGKWHIAAIDNIIGDNYIKKNSIRN